MVSKKTGQPKNKAEQVLDEAFENVKTDRRRTEKIVDDLLDFIQEKGQESHARIGLALAKFMENQTKLNDQLIKIAEIHKKSTKQEQILLNHTEKDDFYKSLEEKDLELFKKADNSNVLEAEPEPEPVEKGLAEIYDPKDEN